MVVGKTVNESQHVGCFSEPGVCNGKLCGRFTAYYYNKAYNPDV